MKLSDKPIKKIERLLSEYKQVNLKQFKNISRWITQLIGYALNDTRKNKRTKYRAYSRGQIVKVNFGFNVGYELGGVHYAVVVSKSDSIHSGLVNVIPLTSNKGKRINKYEVDMGEEFYRDIHDLTDLYSRRVFTSNLYRDKAKDELNSLRNRYAKQSQVLTPELIETYPSILGYITMGHITVGDIWSVKMLEELYNQEIIKYKIELQRNKNLMKELRFLKPGCIAKVEQLQSISKSRILDPLYSSDSLHKVKVSTKNMESLNKMMQNIYIFDK